MENIGPAYKITHDQLKFFGPLSGDEVK